MVGGYLGFVYALFAYSPREDIPSYEQLSNAVILNRTKDSPEAKAFLQRYPGTWVFVERVDHFAVHHQITKADLTGEPVDKDAPVEYVQPYLSLNVRLDSQGYPASVVLWCTTDAHGQFKIEIPSENELRANLDKDICGLL